MRSTLTAAVPLSTIAVLASALLGACREAAGPAGAADAGVGELAALQLQGAAVAPQGAAAPDAVGGKVQWSRPPEEGAVFAPEVIAVEDTVRVGQRVRVAVHTVLPTGCWTTAGEEVRQSGMTVEITPRDRDGGGASGGAAACTMIYRWGAHAVDLAFDREGLATIRVRGRLVQQDGRTVGEPLTAERTVVVRR